MKATILIADDEPAFLESLSLILGSDFHVLTTSDGLKALSIIKTHPLSLAILDLDMPGIDGMELLRIIRQENIALPVLIMTGRVSALCKDISADLNVQGHLEKPVEIQVLIEKIRTIIHPRETPELKHHFPLMKA